MAINGPGKGDNQDLEDDVFEAEGDFSDDNFEDEAFDEATYDAELESGEQGYSEDDLDDTAWEDGASEAEEAPARGKKKKSAGLGEGARKYLNFNTIAILSAIIIGGAVMLFTIRSETAEQSTGQNIFQSMLNIAGVMDGTLFGDDVSKVQDTAPVEQAADSGFLNNPSSLESSPSENINPPQPIPLAPGEEGLTENAAADAPLAVLPDDMMMADIPRGPEEALPEVAAVEATSASPSLPSQDVNSAEALLKEAIQNREDRQGEAETLPTQMAEEKPLSDVVAAALPPLFEPDVPSAPAESEDPGAAAVTPAPVSSEPQPSEPTPGSDSGTILAAGPDLEARAMITANTQAMEKISATLAQISSRVEKIDSDVSGVVKRQEEDIQSVRQSIDALRQDVTDLKNRPEPAAAPDSGRTSTGATDGSKSQAPKKAKAIDRATDPASPPTVAKAEPAKKAKADKPKTRPAPPAQSSPAALPAAKAKTEAPMPTARWELRAAQPGRAWISRAGQRDMQSVQVGQTIAGLGRVTTISYQNGRWSVVGTTGRVDQ